MPGFAMTAWKTGRIALISEEAQGFGAEDL
jgi:hypothetical protein